MSSNLQNLILSIETRKNFLDDAFADRTDHAAWQERNRAWHDMMEDLVVSERAKHRVANGTHELTLAGIRTSCTAGEAGLISAWLRKAKAKADAEIAARRAA